MNVVIGVRELCMAHVRAQILKCLKRAGLPGEGTTMKWEGDGAWCGELTTRNTGECPNAAVVSRLSQILEETPHPKYNLTAKACQGILRRAERRGKELPKLLKAVLIRQSQGASPQERTDAPAPTEAPTSYAVRIRGAVTSSASAEGRSLHCKPEWGQAETKCR
jgi:hypothetical protein